jgi:hypothetical protein
MVVLILLLCVLVVAPVHSLMTDNKQIATTGKVVYNAHRLAVSGTSIVNGLGTKVELVGTQIDSNEYAKGYFSPQDLQTIKSYGGNCVEIHQLRVGKMMPQRNAIDESYFINNVDQWVSWCEQAEVYCLLNVREFKWVSYGAGMPDWMLDGHGYGSAPYNESTVDKAFIDFLDTDNPLHDDNRQCFIELWKFIANRYKNNQYAMFGLMNEPLCQISLDGTQATHLGITYSNLMEQIVDGIRSVGADNLVFIDRPYVWDWNRVQPVNRTNVVWEDHLYINPSFSLDQWKSMIQNQIVHRFMGDFQKPVYMGEYGFAPFSVYEDGYWPSDLAGEVAFLKSSGIAGYSWHTWGLLEGECYDATYNYLNQSESDYVIQTIFG